MVFKILINAFLISFFFNLIFFLKFYFFSNILFFSKIFILFFEIFMFIFRKFKFIFRQFHFAFQKFPFLAIFHVFLRLPKKLDLECLLDRTFFVARIGRRSRKVLLTKCKRENILIIIKYFRKFSTIYISYIIKLSYVASPNFDVSVNLVWL